MVVGRLSMFKQRLNNAPGVKEIPNSIFKRKITSGRKGLKHEWSCWEDDFQSMILKVID